MVEDYLEAAEKSASFDSIFGVEEDSDLSLKKFDDYWERSRPVEAEKKGVDPNQLVRFVHGGKRPVHTAAWVRRVGPGGGLRRTGADRPAGVGAILRRLRQRQDEGRRHVRLVLRPIPGTAIQL